MTVKTIITSTSPTTTTMTTTCLILAALLLINLATYATASPMLYKRNQEEKYEADLVAVSSTVIPLTVLEVSYGNGGKPSEEYKLAYLRKLRKQLQQRQRDGASDVAASVPLSTGEVIPIENPSNADALITVKSQKAKVTSI